VFGTKLGTISYVGTGIDCPGTRNLLGGYRGVLADWVVTGGTGLYAGATGSGTQNVRPEDDGDEVNTHYVGSIAVPGVAFRHLAADDARRSTSHLGAIVTARGRSLSGAYSR
jgi:hypothetical protein